MYQPALRPDQVRTLCCLKLRRRKPMSKLLQDIVDQYLQVQGDWGGQMVREEEIIRVKRRP